MMKMLSTCAAVLALLAAHVHAAAPDDAWGLWLTAEKDAVVEFRPCANRAGALCGTIVWDKDAGTPADACGMHIAQLERYDNAAWRDGWVYDPRDKKKYKAAIRVKGGELRIRAFIGAEVLGQTETLSRVQALPPAPACES